jgi:hypothetical protein
MKYKFKIRCSQIGKIMGEPRTKADKENGVLSKTAQSYCDSWIIEKVYGRRKQIKSKYLDKGNLCEEESIKYLVDNDFLFYAEKNTKRFENEFCTGEPDLIQPSKTVDTKNSWSVDTFPLLATSLPSKDYYWQGVGYMWLTGRLCHEVIYILSNTPELLIEKEIEYAIKGLESITQIEYNKIEKEIKHNHNFDDLPPSKRVKIFGFRLDKKEIEKIKIQVAKCQKYIEGKVKELDL